MPAPGYKPESTSPKELLSEGKKLGGVPSEGRGDSAMPFRISAKLGSVRFIAELVQELGLGKSEGSILGRLVETHRPRSFSWRMDQDLALRS